MTPVHIASRLVGTGSPVLFIQGVGVHGDGWLPQVDALSPRYACLTVDNRGLGGSQALGPEKPTVPLMVDDALGLIDRAGWGDCHVVGHSMGGHIATALALAAPKRVRSLALLCTSARGKDMPPVSASFLRTSLRSRVGTRRQRRRAFLEIVMPKAMRETEDLDAWAERMAVLFGHDLADTPPVVMKQIGAYRAHDATARLTELASIPTLVLSATEDPLSPPALGRALADGIPGARHHVIEASHGVTITHAAEVNRLLEEHFAAADVRRSDR